VVTAITGEVDVGVVAEDPGGVVLDVLPYGAGWTAGIRPGQRVISISAATDPGGWAIETSDGSLQHRVSAGSANASLRLTAAASIVASLLVLFAIRDARNRRRRSELLAALAAVLAVAPFVVDNQPVTANVAVAAAGVAPAIWLARWHATGQAVRVALVGSALVVSVAWGFVRTLPSPEIQPLGDAWAFAVAAGTTAMLLFGIGMTRARAIQAIAALRLLDAAIAALAVFAAAAAYAIGASAVWAAAIALVPLIVYARSRRAIRGSLDRFLLAELRERAAIVATEAERARMAREIHDDPLQAIAGVIQQLEEPAPDTDSARDALRDVAARLRGVATELHPPILDDLGLVPAIEAAARGWADRIPIEVLIDDMTGYSPADRPSADVELAVFRITQETIANALKHSRGHQIWVQGNVAAAAVTLAIIDDGVGFSPARAAEAVRAGHLGISSMQQRATAIGASVEISNRPAGGTTVSIRWPA
jgi:signal transduction histidine kinase